MFKFELSAHDVLWLGKIVIDWAGENPDRAAEIKEIWEQLQLTIEKGNNV